MQREAIPEQVRQTLGVVPGWIEGLPNRQLEHQWGLIPLGPERQAAVWPRQGARRVRRGNGGALPLVSALPY
jgi:hypothetical protein